jgi:sulfatase maturation enzyme AslB (radical SAM superfamily)
MFEFHKPDPVLFKLLGPQKLRAGSDYVRSPFTLLTELDGRRYCYSTLTKQGFALPPAFDPEGRWSCREIEADPALTDLMAGWFLKPADRDETELYESVAAMMRAFHVGKGIASYVILPTMACNARCTYCYEAGARPVTMSRETAAETLAYLLRSRRPETRLYIQWFGGEPLLGVDTIDFILEGLRAEGVSYRCGFTTNGSRIDEALADRMAGDWNTDSVQITVDGTEESYQRIKRYVSCDDAYRRVLRAIGLLSDRGISVMVRINLDGTNGGEVGGILRDLSEAVRVKDKVRVYLSPIYQLRMSERCLAAWQEAERLSPQIGAAGFPTAELLGLDTRFRIFRCMASNPVANVLITPEGRLSFCQHELEGPLCGSVAEGITAPEIVNRYATPIPVPEKCRDCAFLPDCTAFRPCPVYDRDCLAVRRLKTPPQLHAMIRRKLEKADAEERDEGREAFEAQIFHTE